MSLGAKADIYIVSSETSNSLSNYLTMLQITENGRQNLHGTVKLIGGRRGNTSYRTIYNMACSLVMLIRQNKMCIAKYKSMYKHRKRFG